MYSVVLFTVLLDTLWNGKWRTDLNFFVMFVLVESYFETMQSLFIGGQKTVNDSLGL